MMHGERETTPGPELGLPAHVAIIMDGNRRWAQRRGLPVAAGHKQGMEALRRTVRACIRLGIPYLTVFAFSSENWGRPAREIKSLMTLLRAYMRRELPSLVREGVRVRLIGERGSLPPDIIALADEAESLTRDNRVLTLTIALNYGGRQEMARAARGLAVKVAEGTLRPEDIDEDLMRSQMFAPDIPDPDLVIRTSGEQRLSNFLLWQVAYAELVFTPTLWPDFDAAELAAAVTEYRSRNRRFGGYRERA
jgi:undecaprenyl diphosphate synthase